MFPLRPAVPRADLVRWLVVAACCTQLASCGRTPVTPVYQMGERAEIGSFVYSVLEARWVQQLGEEPSPRLPKASFLLLRVSATNGSTRDFTIPQMVLVAPTREEHSELSEGEGVADWMGIIRGVEPLETKTRWVLFDVPPADYRLRVADDAFDPADAKTALIEVPIRLAAGSDLLPANNPVR
jgi:hypothetical protein